MASPELPYGYPAKSDSDRGNTQGPNGEASSNNSGGSTSHHGTAPMSRREGRRAEESQRTRIAQENARRR